MWYTSQNGSLDQPSAIDTTSSRKYVYIRKNFEVVAATEDIPAHYQWQEMKIPKADMGIYEKTVNHDEALDDVYAALTELAEIITEE